MSELGRPNKQRAARDAHKALAHSTRVDILLQIALDGRASPKQVARSLDSPLNKIAYHVDILLKNGALELVETNDRRGAREHVYAVIQTSEVVRLLLVSKLTEQGHSTSTTESTRMLAEAEITSAITKVVPVQLDQKGAREIAQILEKLSRSLRAVERGSLNRLKASGSTPVDLNIGVVAFPWAKEKDSEQRDTELE